MKACQIDSAPIPNRLTEATPARIAEVLERLVWHTENNGAEICAKLRRQLVYRRMRWNEQLLDP